MKRIWEKIKIVWWELWGIYEDDDDSIQHLSRSDKINIWCGSFIMCMVTVAIGMIATYFATATEDEYVSK